MVLGRLHLLLRDGAELGPGVLHLGQRGLDGLLRAAQGVLGIGVGHPVQLAAALLGPVDDVGALLPRLLDDLALGDNGLGVQLGLTHHLFHFFFGPGHIVVAGGDQFLGLFQLQRQLGADLVQDIQCFVPVDGAFFGVEGNTFGLVDHVIQHVDQALHVLFFHVSGHILSSIPPQPVRVHIFQGAGDSGSSPAPWWS